MTGPAPLRPMRLPQSLALFGGPMLLFLVLQRVVVPALDARGVAPLVNFFVLASPHVLFFFGALIAFRMEGNPPSWPVLRARLRLTRLRGRDWGWAAVATVGLIGSYLAVYALALPVLQILADAFPDPEVVGRIMGDSTTFAGYPLSGNAWLLGAFLIVFFFNVVGEELWWRGYIFPRQELAHGSRTWIVHGLLWAGFHMFSPTSVLLLLPGSLLLAWIVQRRGKTWIALIAHGSLNALAMIRIVTGILS